MIPLIRGFRLVDFTDWIFDVRGGHQCSHPFPYPKRRTAKRINFLTKISAVADTYVALVTERGHRPALQPYFAVETILKDVRNGLFDPMAVRGLLETISLFPIGSFAQRSDQRVGRVIRSNGAHFTRPIMEIWQPDKMEIWQPDKLDRVPSVVAL